MSMLTVLAENILILLSFDDQRAPIIRNTIAPELWPGVYRILAARTYDYIDRHGKAPGDHLPDIIADKLDEKSGREAKLYEDIILNLHRAREGINPDYIMGQLEQFVRRQSLRGIATELGKALLKDTDESLDEAERLINDAKGISVKAFDPGTRLNDKTRALKFLDMQEACFPTGIRELDRRGFGPTRKELWLFVGDKKSGKSWMLAQLGKMALLHQMRVLHITLELSEERATQRYFQTLFQISKRSEKAYANRFVRDKDGVTIVDREDFFMTPKLAFDDPKVEVKLSKLIDKWGDRLLRNIFIKQFPTGMLTLEQYRAYLDNLEMTNRFVPDLVILDYPDLMSVDPDNVRGSLDYLFKGLRGTAIKRNHALAVVSQSNRAGSDRKTLTGKYIAEDYNKLRHCDCAITYSQTQYEKALGLARLNVIAGRNDMDGFEVVISQRYATGAFVIDSNIARGRYWELIPQDDGNGQ